MTPAPWEPRAGEEEIAEPIRIIVETRLSGPFFRIDCVTREAAERCEEYLNDLAAQRELGIIVRRQEAVSVPRGRFGVWVQKMGPVGIGDRASDRKPGR